LATDLAAQFRLQMDHLDADDPEDQLLFFRMLDLLKGDVIAELAPRMLLASSTAPFRLLVAEAAYYYPDPEWLAPLSRVLRRETDLNVFSVCVRALVRIGTAESEEEFRQLSSQTHEPAKRELLSEALQASDPDSAFEHHLSRLLQGSSNPTVANQAAVELRRILKPDHLESLLVVVHHEDLLIARHVLKLLAGLPTLEAALFLRTHFLECHTDILEDRQFKEILTTLRSTSVADLWPALLAHLESFQDRAPEALERLRAAGPETGATAELKTLRDSAQGLVELFLLDVAALLVEGKTPRLPTLYNEAFAGLQARARRNPHAVDTCASGLEFMVVKKLVAPGEVLDQLFQAFQSMTGREGTARVLGTLLAPTDAPYLEAILAARDSEIRAAALDAIAARHDPRFLAFLFRACQDSIEEVANRMIEALGGLEGANEQTLVFLASRVPEEVRLALRIIRINHVTSLASQVMGLLVDAATREELSLEAVATLGELGTVDSELLGQLNSGQSLRMQVALATALAGRGNVEIALALARKVQLFRQPELWMLAAEGLVNSAAGPLPLEVSELLVALAQACWEERSPGPWRIRIIQAIPSIQGADAGHLEALLGLLVACADDKRAHAGWSPEHQNQLSAAIRHLRRGKDIPRLEV